MNNYSERITFKSTKDFYKSSTWKIVVSYMFLAALTICIAGTWMYNIYNKPTEISAEDVYNLLLEDDTMEICAIEEAKKVVEYEPSYVGDFYVVDIKKVEDSVLSVEIANAVNYPGAYINLYGTATLKYKRGWYVDKVTYNNNFGLQPLVSAGESFLNTLRTDMYNQGYFEMNGVKNAFATSYVDSLCVMNEEGDFDATKVKIAPYNKDGRVDIEATLKYNFGTWSWDIVSFDRVGTR